MTSLWRHTGIIRRCTKTFLNPWIQRFTKTHSISNRHRKPTEIFWNRTIWCSAEGSRSCLVSEVKEHDLCSVSNYGVRIGMHVRYFITKHIGYNQESMRDYISHYLGLSAVPHLFRNHYHGKQLIECILKQKAYNASVTLNGTKFIGICRRRKKYFKF